MKKVGGLMSKLNVSLKARIKQLFCRHDRLVELSCATKGINSKEGYWYLKYRCGLCGFSYGEWIKADKEEVERIFEMKVHKIG